MVIAGFTLLALTLVLRAATAKNRHIQRKLFASALAFGAFLLVALALQFGSLNQQTALEIEAIKPLLLIFGVVNLLVAILVNPWREDRLPDRFPNIVQDAIVVLFFAAGAIVVLRDRAVVTTAAGAVVLGLALQDTLGNLFAGLAIQIEKPFRVGNWVRLGNEEGLVSEITWRATKLRTKSGNLMIVPNNVLARERIVNFSEPTPLTRLEIEVSADFETRPNRVKEVILGALEDEPLLSRDRGPEVLISELGDSAIKYAVHVWTTEFGSDVQLRDRVRSAVYYAFRRAGIVFPYPTQVHIRRDEQEPSARRDSLATALRDAEIFAALSDEQRAELLAMARPHLYGAREVIVREGDNGSSMFVIVDGEAVVTVRPSVEPVARLRQGDFFGEMSLLTGDPRTATVRAGSDCHVIEITSDGFRRFLMAEPDAADVVCAAVADRRSALERHRTGTGETRSAVEPSRSLIARMRRFLRLATS